MVGQFDRPTRRERDASRRFRGHWERGPTRDLLVVVAEEVGHIVAAAGRNFCVDLARVVADLAAADGDPLALAVGGRLEADAAVGLSSFVVTPRTSGRIGRPEVSEPPVSSSE